jgi:hypothetical protein
MTNPESKPTSGNPFSYSFVIWLTKKQVRAKIHNSIDYAITKTLGRIPEFTNDHEKSIEIFKTLSTLYNMRNQLEQILNQTGE